MTPKKIFIFFVLTLISIAVLMLIFPKKGIKISDNLSIQFVTWDEILNPEEKKDITNIINNNEVDEDTAIVKQTKPEDIINQDSAYIDSQLVVYTPIPINVDSTLQAIDFPNNADTMLYPLFNALTKAKTSGKPIHILHYGDSQIEVDRMTSYIRLKLQNSFGGYGPGFHSGIQAYNFKQPMITSYSDNWKRYKVFPHKDKEITHKRFGISPSFSMFKEVIDSSEEEITAWIQFETAPSGFNNVKKYDKLKMFYGNNPTTVSIKTTDNEVLINSDSLPITEGLKIKTWNFASTPGKLKLEFQGFESPEIYGYSFESNNGVMVDNIPVRGSGGLFFGRFDLSLTAQIYQNLNVKLIILQFGGNVVSNDSMVIRGYASNLGKQIQYLHNIAPSAQLILIGPADMSYKDKESYLTRPTLPFLVEQLKYVALKNNCAFWNMYEAMGGENSMPSWVFNNPPLAEKDFIHFNPRGAKIIAKMFYKSLIVEYNKYINYKNK